MMVKSNDKWAPGAMLVIVCIALVVGFVLFNKSRGRDAAAEETRMEQTAQGW